jgi:hypothetical protein
MLFVLRGIPGINNTHHFYTVSQVSVDFPSTRESIHLCPVPTSLVKGVELKSSSSLPALPAIM